LSDPGGASPAASAADRAQPHSSAENSRGSSSIDKAPELGDGLAALFELLDRGDDLVAVEGVEKIVDRPLAVPLARFQVARQDGLRPLDGFQHLLIGGHRRTPRNSHASIQWGHGPLVPDPHRAEQVDKPSPRDFESLGCDSSAERSAALKDSPDRCQGAISMLMFKERRPSIRTLRGWAIAVLREARAIGECEEHGWMQDRADPHARERAFDIARRDPPAGVSCEDAIAELRDVLESIGDSCPECPAEP
jgi:hypothetical protein